MPTDTERREVARRLREIKPCKSGHIKWWEIAQALGLKQPAGWFGWEKFEPDSANRLADFIDPSDMLYVTYSRSTCGPNGMAYMVKVRHRARGLERDFYAVDLEKLLEVLDEMEITIKCAGPDVKRDYVENWANEVREALGVGK